MDSSFRDRTPSLTRRQTLQALSGAAAALLGGGSSRRLMAADAAEPASAAIDWKQISQQFLLNPELTYLNTGSLGSIPKPVLEARRIIENKLESNPVGEGFGSVLRDAEAVSGKVAEFLGCDVKEVTVTRNTTEGINFIAEGLNLQPGQHVLTTNQEHGGGLGAWKFLKKYRGVLLDVAEIPSPPKSEDEIVELFRAKITAQTRVLFCSHVLFSSGVKMPIKRLSELAHQHHCVMVVDGAQACGGIAVNVKELGCDAYASSGHKYMLGPKGTGILYISAAAREHIKPMQLDDGLGFYTAIRGTSCMPEAIGLGGAMDWVKQIGREAVFARLMTLRNALYEVLKNSPHVKLVSPPPESSMASHLVCYSVTDRERYAKGQEQFSKDQVVVKHVGINNIDYRLSVHLYNTEADVERFAASLKRAFS